MFQILKNKLPKDLYQAIHRVILSANSHTHKPIEVKDITEYQITEAKKTPAGVIVEPAIKNNKAAVTTLIDLCNAMH